MENIDKEKIIKKKIKQFLIEIGINPRLKAFKYWTTAILFAVEKEQEGEDLGRFMELYEYIGRKHKSTVSKVERNMRYIFEKKDYGQIFGIPYSINNTAFLFLARERILKEINVYC